MTTMEQEAENSTIAICIPTRFTYSKTLKALILNFRTALRSVTRMYSAHSGIDSGIGRESISKKTYTVFTYITSVNT